MPEKTWTPCAARLLKDLRAFEMTGQVGPELARYTPRHLEAILHDWPLWARPEQLPPRGRWTAWLILGGRGAGKTRAGAEHIRALATGTSCLDPRGVGEPFSPLALVGATLDEARTVMVEGESGLLAIHPKAERPAWSPSLRLLEWPNGARAYTHSADNHEALRGPQFAAAWCDEIAKWRHARAAFDQVQFGLRLGGRPHQVITTTPRPVPLVRMLMAREDVAVTRMPTLDNAANLSPDFLAAIVARYAGTRLGRQELDGELLAGRADTLFPRALVEAGRVAHAPRALSRIVVAVDPPASAGRSADACGIVAAGTDAGGEVYVLADATVERARPDAWARRAIGLYRRLHVDRIVVEVNQGGDMAEAVLRQVDADVPVSRVRATRGKWLRAEPVAALYEQGRVHHVGAFRELEDEMADFGPDGLSDKSSPDRLDALVWAVTALIGGSEPRVARV